MPLQSVICSYCYLSAIYIFFVFLLLSYACLLDFSATYFQQFVYDMPLDLKNIYSVCHFPTSRTSNILVIVPKLADTQCFSFFSSLCFILYGLYFHVFKLTGSFLLYLICDKSHPVYLSFLIFYFSSLDFLIAYFLYLPLLSLS